MDLKKKSSFYYKGARFLLWGLVLSFLHISCRENSKEIGGISIQWNHERADAIILPLTLFPVTNIDSIINNLAVRLIDNPVSMIHENIVVKEGLVIFRPLIAFTQGLKYEVYYSNKRIGEFEIPPLKVENLTEIISVYPTADTIPENTLKLYFVFSQPMQEGQAMHNISFVKNDKDTVSVFLDLEQELWNKERTTLTLWFDPGRIKRDLQPNINLGMPLQEDNNYKLIVDKSWRDERGLGMRSNYEKIFYVGKRDNESPHLNTWIIDQPKAFSKDTLIVHLHESLDYLLLKNAIYITDTKSIPIVGSFEPAANETKLRFIPAEPWKPADYMIHVEARLEDLAGNNLNRLFDKDLSKADNDDPRKVYTIKFRVE